MIPRQIVAEGKAESKHDGIIIENREEHESGNERDIDHPVLGDRLSAGDKLPVDNFSKRTVNERAAVQEREKAHNHPHDHQPGEIIIRLDHPGEVIGVIRQPDGFARLEIAKHEAIRRRHDDAFVDAAGNPHRLRPLHGVHDGNAAVCVPHVKAGTARSHAVVVDFFLRNRINQRLGIRLDRELFKHIQGAVVGEPCNPVLHAGQRQKRSAVTGNHGFFVLFAVFRYPQYTDVGRTGGVIDGISDDGAALIGAVCRPKTVLKEIIDSVLAHVFRRNGDGECDEKSIGESAVVGDHRKIVGIFSEIHGFRKGVFQVVYLRTFRFPYSLSVGGNLVR